MVGDLTGVKGFQKVWLVSPKRQKPSTHSLAVQAFESESPS